MKHVKHFILFVLLLCCILFAKPEEAKADGAGNYYIKVNVGTCVTTVYKKDGTPYKAMICSPGAGNNTPIGTFYTPAKYRWKMLMGPSYGQYSTRIYGGVLFHSVYYWVNGDPTTMDVSAYNLLGTRQSHGCIRLLVKVAKWIYDNCPLGTKVITFWGTSADDPLGKPSFTRISSAKYWSGYGVNWDPTDPDPNNPFHQYKPTPSIRYHGSYDVQYKSRFSIKPHLSITDGAGHNIASSAKYYGRVNTSKLGYQYIKVTVTNKYGKTRTVTFRFRVVDKTAPTINGTKNVNLAEDQAYNYLKGVSAKTLTGKNVTSSVKVYYHTSKGYRQMSNPKSYAFTESGKYKICYKVTGPNKKIKRVYRYVNVVNHHIVIKPVDTIKIEIGSTVKPLSYIKLCSPTTTGKTYSTKYAVYSSKVNVNKLGYYNIYYRAVFPNKPYTTGRLKLRVQVVNDKKPVITDNGTTLHVTKGDIANLLDGIKAVTGLGKNITSSVEVYTSRKLFHPETYTFKKAGELKVTYKVTVPGGSKSQIYTRTYIVSEPETPTEPESPTEQETTTNHETTTEQETTVQP